MAGRGGKTPGAGRKPGSVNKSTAEIKELAQQYAPAALKELSRLATKAKSEQARVAAANTILDRAYGKPPQAVTGDGGGPIETRVILSFD